MMRRQHAAPGSRSGWQGCWSSSWRPSAAVPRARCWLSVSISWTAEMAFATIIGGLGTIEGPIIGTAVFMVLQQTLSSFNAWYLIVFGLVAIVVALFARRGLWGLVDTHLNVRLFPVGYYLHSPGGAHRGPSGTEITSAAPLA